MIVYTYRNTTTGEEIEAEGRTEARQYIEEGYCSNCTLNDDGSITEHGGTLEGMRPQRWVRLPNGD